MGRIRRLFRRSSEEMDLDRELRFHLERQIADYIAAGMSPGEARRRARREFCGLDLVKEEVRDTRWEVHLEQFVRDLRYALLNLRRDPRFTCIAVFALSLGIGASTVVFSVFYNLMFNAFSAKDASRLVVPVMRSEANPGQKDSNLEPLPLHLDDLDVI